MFLNKNYEEGYDTRLCEEVCDYCNCAVDSSAGEVLRVALTGDIIHAECWDEYAADNRELLTRTVQSR